MNALVPLVVAANAAVFVLGGTITPLAYRASRLTVSVALKRLATGFAVVAHSLSVETPERERGRRVA